MAESLPTCPLNLGKVCNLSEPQFPYFSNVIIRPFVPETHNAIWAKPKSRVNVMVEETLNPCPYLSQCLSVFFGPLV